MVKLLVCYGAPEDPAAFDAYYAATHAPLASTLPGLRRFEWGKVLEAPDGSPSPYYFIAELVFDDAEALGAAMGSPEGQAASTDVGNFASGGATLLIVEA
jgi:uncharacterized protein (TIGR02118 family)